MSIDKREIEEYSEKYLIFKILYKTKTFKEVEIYSKIFKKKYKSMKCRIIHPLWFIIFIIWMIVWIILQWIVVTYGDFKNEFIII